LVAITASSRRQNSRTNFPVSSSETPAEYMSAVSKKLIPASTAARTSGRAAASSSTHGRHWAEP
jgi:hypothetical protein